MSFCPISSRRLIFIMFLALLLVLGVAGPLSGADFRGDETVTIGKEEVIDDDLLLTGNVINVNGVINGDLLAAGSQVTVNGVVKGSLLFAGQTLVLNGKVEGTVYSGGASLTIGPDATVGRNLLFGGYSFRSDPGSVVGRDNFIGGYQAAIDGEVTRNFYASVAALELNGKIGGNVDAFVDQPGATFNPQLFSGFGGQPLPPALQTGLRVGPEATIGGQFNYVSPVEQSGAIAVTPSGGVTYQAPEPQESDYTPPTGTMVVLNWMLERLREFVTLFVFGLLALWLMPVLFAQMGEHTISETTLAGVWGALVVIVGYGGAIFVTILLITLVVAFATATLAGLATSVFALGFSSLALAFTIFSMLAVYGSKLVVFYPLMQLTLEKMIPGWNRYRIVPLSLGALLFVLVRSIPWLGPLFAVVVTLIGLGAIWMTLRDRLSRPRPVAPKLVLTPA